MSGPLEPTPRTARASAAGKLMIAGEYAVLGESGHCLAMAVGSVAEAVVAPAAGDRAARTLRAFDQRWTWQHGQTPPSGLAERVETALRIPALQPLAAQVDLELDVGGQVAGRKLGLGTSAAAMVATVRALVASGDAAAGPGDSTNMKTTAKTTERNARLLAWLQGAHQRGQGGRGSGYDLATILAGGVIRYRRDPAAWRHLHWPTRLHAAALFTGEPAATEARLQAQETAGTAGLAEITAAERVVAAAWAADEVTPLLDALTQAERAFDRLAASVPGLRTPAVERTRAAIRGAGAVARTSGAGGGDCVLAFAEDPYRIDALTRDWERAGGVVAARLPAALSPSTERGGPSTAPPRQNEGATHADG